MNWAGAGALFLAIAVMLGAFGAHALRGRFDAYSMDIWEKAVLYHFLHSIGLLVVPLLGRMGMISARGADRVCWLLAAGILIFSGTLYALAFTGNRALGAVTPMGGTAFIAAWLLLAWQLFRSQ